MLLLHLAHGFQRFFLIESFFRLFNQSHHVAHAQYSRRHSIRIKRLYIRHFLTRSDKLYRLARNFFYAQRGAASGIAVHLSENNARQLHLLVESLRRIDRVLTCHCVYDQQNLVGLRLFSQLYKLRHHVLVDVQSACRIYDYDVVALVLCVLLRRLEYLFGLILPHFKGIHARRAGYDYQLLYRRRSIYVARHKQRLFSFFLQVCAQLAAHSRLARSLQARHQYYRRRFRRYFQIAPLTSQKRNHLVAHYLNYLLTRSETLQNLRAHGFF